jgi:hypothetical protein
MKRTQRAWNPHIVSLRVLFAAGRLGWQPKGPKVATIAEGEGECGS